jgi:HPt (histidine-containing phosphotransfer) domain-containing protein
LQNDNPGDAARDSAKVLDWDAAHETVDGDEELLRIVLSAMLEECPLRLKDLEQAVQQSDAPLLRRSAHTVKGNLRIFGHCYANELAQQLEVIGESGTCDGAGEVLSSLLREMEKVLSEVQAFVDS